MGRPRKQQSGPGDGVVNEGTKSTSLSVSTSEDVVHVRRQVRTWAIQQGLSLVDQTKIVTAASELARNALYYAGGGTVLIQALNNGRRGGLKITFEDKGPGIADIEL